MRKDGKGRKTEDGGPEGPEDRRQRTEGEKDRRTEDNAGVRGKARKGLE